MRTIPVNPIHRLVSLGDSLVQGFQNGCIHRPDLSFPAMLARAMGPDVRFDQPDFSAQGGLPLNLEAMLRGLEPVAGQSLDSHEWVEALYYIYQTVTRIRHHWETKGLEPVPHYTPWHNQAVWGAEVCDTWVLSDKACRDELSQTRASLTAIGMLPDHAQYITACRVLNPGALPEFASFSMLDNVRWFGENGGIENLLVWIGSNNVVGAVTSLQTGLRKPGDSGRMPGRRYGTITETAQFARDFSYLASSLAKIPIRNVFVGTIPYVTVPPLLLPPGSSVNSREKFEAPALYHPWLDKNSARGLTRADVRLLNETVDQFNRIIHKTCEMHGFHTVPLNRMVASLISPAEKVRLSLFPAGLIEALQTDPDLRYLVDAQGMPALTADFPETDEKGRLVRGGIFSLDGLHPTTTGYGLIAHLFYTAMKRQGVAFSRPLDWRHIVQNDTLLMKPPLLLSAFRPVMQLLTSGITRALSLMGYHMWKGVTEGR